MSSLNYNEEQQMNNRGQLREKHVHGCKCTQAQAGNAAVRTVGRKLLPPQNFLADHLIFFIN
jgi:hypothetical protein